MAHGSDNVRRLAWIAGVNWATENEHYITCQPFKDFRIRSQFCKVNLSNLGQSVCELRETQDYACTTGGDMARGKMGANGHNDGDKFCWCQMVFSLLFTSHQRTKVQWITAIFALEVALHFLWRQTLATFENKDLFLETDFIRAIWNLMRNGTGALQSHAKKCHIRSFPLGKEKRGKESILLHVYFLLLRTSDLLSMTGLLKHVKMTAKVL